MPSPHGGPEVLVGGRCARAPCAVGACLRQRRGRPAAQRRRAAAVHRVGLADRAGGAAPIRRTSSSMRGSPVWCSSSARITPPLPRSSIDAARDRGLALIVLHREVKFVVADGGSARADHLGADRGAARPRRGARAVHRPFSARCAGRLHRPSARADPRRSRHPREPRARDRGRAKCLPPSRRSCSPSGSCARGLRSGRAAPGRRCRGRDWLIVPVEARGIRWGSLIALPGPAAPRGPRRRARAGRDRARDRPARRRRRRRVGAHRSAPAARRAARGTLRRDRGAAARLEAAGLPVHGARFCTGSSSRARRSTAGVGGCRRPASFDGRALAGSAPEGVAAPAATVLLSLPDEMRRSTTRPRSGSCARSAGDDADRAVVVHRRRRDEGLDEALVSLQEAVDLARGRRRRSARGPSLRRVEDRPLVQLVTSLRDDYRLLEHGERMLTPLIVHDLERGGDLLDVLEAMLAHPGNRTAAASASHLSRSVFYQRIALIEDLLGVDLDDGETQTALHLALLVRRRRAVRALTGLQCDRLWCVDVDLPRGVCAHRSTRVAHARPSRRAPIASPAVRSRSSRPRQVAGVRSNSTVASPASTTNTSSTSTSPIAPGVISHTPVVSSISSRCRWSGTRRRPGAAATGSCASTRAAASVTRPAAGGHESNPSPSASRVLSRMLRRPRLWSARSSDQRVALMPIAAAGSGGKGSGRSRTMRSDGALGRDAVEQVEHHLAGEAGRGDTETGETGRVRDLVLAGAAEERAEPRARVDRTRPAMREPQALELREHREEVARELLERLGAVLVLRRGRARRSGTRRRSRRTGCGRRGSAGSSGTGWRGR